MRLFIAVEVPLDIQKKASLLASKFSKAYPNLRASWVAVGNMHLTLAFLGETDPSRIPQIKKAAQEAARDIPAFSISLSGLGVFPQKGPPRILWVGIEEGSQTLALLAQNLRAELSRHEIIFDTKPFHPHLTLARIKPARHPDSSALIQKEGFQNESLPLIFPPRRIFGFFADIKDQRSKEVPSAARGVASLGNFLTSEIILMESKLSSQGPKYTLLERFKLNAKA